MIFLHENYYIDATIYIYKTYVTISYKTFSIRIEIVDDNFDGIRMIVE